MKRVGHLYEQIYELPNLQEAFLRVQRGKAGKCEVRRFRERLSKELASLAAALRFRDKIRVANAMECPEMALALIAFVNRADSVPWLRKVLIPVN